MSAKPKEVIEINASQLVALRRRVEAGTLEPQDFATIDAVLESYAYVTQLIDQKSTTLDNNICERALKKAILHRKNALFYKTQNGAAVGDLHMSLIHTCELCGANPFDYLTQLQRHVEEVAAAPDRWLPWNYRDACSPD